MGRPLSKHSINRVSLHTRTQVVKILGSCSCIEGFKSRDLIDPQCAYHDFGCDVAELIDELEAARAEIRELRK